MTTRGLAVRTHALVHVYRSAGHDVAALAGVDLTVGAGEMIGLLGPSGSGKSTLLSLLAGLFRPSAGKVFLGDREVSGMRPRELDTMHARHVSLMLQGAGRNLLPYLTPAENIAFAQRAARRVGRHPDDGDGAAGLPEVDWLLAVVGLQGRGSAALADLSPGHVQLVALAVLLATRPGLILADEPTSQLDHASRDEVLDTMRRVNRELGTTIIVVTHDPDVARWMPRTVTIRDGRIGGEGRSGEEYSVVTADGFLPLPAHVLEELPAGTLVRLHRQGDEYRIQIEDKLA